MPRSVTSYIPIKNKIQPPVRNKTDFAWNLASSTSLTCVSEGERVNWSSGPQAEPSFLSSRCHRYSCRACALAPFSCLFNEYLCGSEIHLRRQCGSDFFGCCSLTVISQEKAPCAVPDRTAHLSSSPARTRCFVFRHSRGGTRVCEKEEEEENRFKRRSRRRRGEKVNFSRFSNEFT